MSGRMIALISSAIAVLPVVLAQSISPSNSTPIAAPAPPFSEQIQIAPLSFPVSNTRVNLTALTANAWARTINESKLIATPLSVSESSPSLLNQSTSFAVINCDPVAGILQPIDAVKQAITRNALAIILYSTVAISCSLTTGSGVPDTYPIYTTTKGNDLRSLLGGTYLVPTSYPSQWAIGGRSALVFSNSNSDSGMSSPSSGNYTPGGPSPSTAVAMIILYSITGVITALFLIVIITGAVRAHRHPERYGPRNVLGRPRQSRARGLARAMLETLPIVKFGEKEEDAKTGDVELAQPTTTNERRVDGTTGVATADTTTGTHEDSKSAHTVENPDSTEIVAAEAVATRASPEPTVSVDDDSLGCSICTEDFEKGQNVRVLPCKHQFHPACIDPWLLNVSGTCPLCRIDLHPITSINHASGQSDHLPPPLDPDGSNPPSNRASRRMSGLWDVLNPRRMAQATPEERIEALRRVREQRGSNPIEESETRRRRRLTARLGETFGVRTRARGTSPVGTASSSEVEVPATVAENPASPTGVAPGTSTTTH